MHILQLSLVATLSGRYAFWWIPQSDNAKYNACIIYQIIDNTNLPCLDHLIQKI